MLFVMTNNYNAYTAGNFTKEEMIRESFQIYPALISIIEVKSLWVGTGAIDE
jgi:hypothetical protein